ncbi:MAG: hypothetical protein ABMA00_21530 [Gemmatimonas sp.]
MPIARLAIARLSMMFWLSACYSATPLTPGPGPAAFAGVVVIRVTQLDGKRRDVWYPSIDGDSVLVGLQGKIVHPSTPPVRIAMREISKLEHVKVREGVTALVIAGIIAAAYYAFVFLSYAGVIRPLW